MDSFSSDSHELEKRRKSLRADNERYLQEFRQHLISRAQLGDILEERLFDVDFFLNTYLLEECALSMPEGCAKVDDFLGDYFQRECPWAIDEDVRYCSTSLRQFYHYMYQRGHVSQDEYYCLILKIAFDLEEWMLKCRMRKGEGYSLSYLEHLEKSSD